MSLGSLGLHASPLKKRVFTVFEYSLLYICKLKFSRS